MSYYNEYSQKNDIIKDLELNSLERTFSSALQVY